MSTQLLNRKKADKPDDGKVKPLPSRSKRTRTYGVDVDGSVIRVVELFDDAVVSYSTYQGETTLDAFQQFLATKPAGYVSCCAALRDLDFKLLLNKITAPTLVIGSDKDPSTPWEGNGDILAREIPSAQNVLLPGAHISNLEQPRAFANGVLDFLRPRVAPRS